MREATFPNKLSKKLSQINGNAYSENQYSKNVPIHPNQLKLSDQNKAELSLHVARHRLLLEQAFTSQRQIVMHQLLETRL